MEQIISISEALLKRQSTRIYDPKPLASDVLKQITDYASSVEPLFPGLQSKVEIIGAPDVKSMMKWRAPHYLALYGEDSDEGRMNMAYIYEQVILYITSLGLGTCWATSVSPKEKHETGSMKWLAVIAFGKPDNGNGWRESSDIKRKPMSEISDKNNSLLEAARIAPSSMNNQPWYFRHKDGEILVYCKKQGLLTKWMIPQNRIDIGIALGNLKTIHPELKFKPAAEKSEKDGYTLMGTICFS